MSGSMMAEKDPAGNEKLTGIPPAPPLIKASGGGA
jgi:hypothetical protein